MSKLYLQVIPVVIGIIAGMFLAFFPEQEKDSKLLTTKLIENGSPIIGNSDAPITILEWGGLPMYFLLQISSEHLGHN